jgi:hypothetical protein
LHGCLKHHGIGDYEIVKRKIAAAESDRYIDLGDKSLYVPKTPTCMDTNINGVEVSFYAMNANSRSGFFAIKISEAG